MNTQILIGGFLSFIMVRYALYLTSQERIWKLIIYFIFSYLANFLLMLDRYYISDSAFRALMISCGYLAGVYFVAFFHRRQIK